MEETGTSSCESQVNAYPVKFEGKGLEFFGIWIVNICLTIITFGIYSAWAKVRTNRYFYGNTMLDGSAFEYLADPKTILKGRVIAVALFAVYSGVSNFYPQASFFAFLVLTFVIPAIVVFSMSFRMRNTGYRGLTFHFQRNFKASYLVFGLPFLFVSLLVGAMIWTAPEVDPNTGEVDPLQAAEYMMTLAYLSLGFFVGFLLYPVWDKMKSRFMVNNSGYGKSEFEFSGTAGAFYKIYLAAFLAFIAGTVAYVLVFGLSQGFGSAGEEGGLSAAFAGVYSIFVFPLYLFMFAYIQAHKLNLIFNQSTMEGVRLQSTLTANYLFYLYLTNSIAIVLSVGLLIPWAKVRTARYRAESVTVISKQPLNQFVRKQEEQRSAIGEEVGEVFDLDIGL